MYHYKHLSIEEREKILSKRAKGDSVRKIAHEHSRSVSTISRELRRCEGEYSAIKAQADYEMKRRGSRRKGKLESDEKLKETVERLMEQDFSPEQISGRLKREGKGEISHNTIYRGIERGLIGKEYKRKLRIKGRPYRKGHKSRVGSLSIEHSIHDRPSAANTREEAGHWESDTVLGQRGSGAIATHVERKSRYLIAMKLPERKADVFAKSTIKAFAEMTPAKCRSFTADHGKEFAQYREIQSALGVTVYFADPGNPGQRGTNENTNGLLRQYFPKRTSFQNVTQRQLHDAVDRLNRRPRKCLDWLSPFEVFWNLVLHLT